jgi:hypothetical protein
MAVAEVPRPPSVGGNGATNLSIGVLWGLYEQRGSEVQDSIGVVGAPMPFLMGLKDDGEDRLFIFVQHRPPGGSYCAQTPAQVEDVSLELTEAGGDPTVLGPEYTKTYVWTPSEAGEYALCAYLDATPVDQPAAINFLKLTAKPVPGDLAFTVAAEAGDAERGTVEVQGTAVVPSDLTASVQERGLPCMLPEGLLAGQQLSELPGNTIAGSNVEGIATGSFTTSYSYAVMKPGAYEVCAYLTPAATETMFFGRPYEVGSATFSVEEELAPPLREPPPTALSPIAVPRTHKTFQPPTLSGVEMSNSRFHVVSDGAHSASRAPTGTRFRFTVSAPATVTIALTRLLPGVLRGRFCDPARDAAGAALPQRCTRRIAVGSIVRRQPEGKGVISFSGVLRHDRLAVGAYVAAVTASNAHGRSGPVSLRFSVAA